MQNVHVVLLALYWVSQSPASEALGTWRVNPVRSALPYSNIATIGFQPHAKGEVFTLYRIEADGHAMTSTILLYLDAKPRDFHDAGCSGTQSSRRVGSQTVEILRTCVNGDSTRFVRRLSGQPNQLVLEVTERQAGGRHFERRLVLEKQSAGAGTTQKKQAESIKER